VRVHLIWSVCKPVVFQLNGLITPVIESGLDQGGKHSVLLSFLMKFLQCLFGFFHIVESEAAGFDQVRHYRLRAPAEDAEQIVDQAALRGIAGDDCFEDVSVAEFL
jgi:hypothetical protein